MPSVIHIAVATTVVAIVAAMGCSVSVEMNRPIAASAASPAVR